MYVSKLVTLSLPHLNAKPDPSYYVVNIHYAPLLHSINFGFKAE